MDKLLSLYDPELLGIINKMFPDLPIKVLNLELNWKEGCPPTIRLECIANGEDVIRLFQLVKKKCNLVEVQNG